MSATFNSLETKFQRIRNRLDVMVVDWKQRYYSNNRDPRIIQTKLKNQTLLSLRTCPHDKYNVRPGEFLTLEPKYKGDGDHPNDDNESDHILSPNLEFHGFDGAFLPISRGDLNDTKKSFPNLSPAQNDPFAKQACNCSCHIEELTAIPELVGDHSKTTLIVEKFREFGLHLLNRDSREVTSTNVPTERQNLAPAPVTPNNQHREESTPSRNKANSAHVTSSDHSLPDQTSQISLPQRPVSEFNSPFHLLSVSTPKKVSALVSRIRSSSGSSVKSEPWKENVTNEAWKENYNVISLYAARKSTGSIVQFELPQVTSDFVDAKTKENDVFAVNLEQAKSIYGKKEAQSEINLPATEEAKTVPHSSGSIDSSIGLYSENGILTLYNYTETS